MEEIVSNGRYENTVKNVLDQYCDAVASTMGPGGKTVIISKGGDIPHVTKDGVSVSESIYFQNPLMNDITLLLKEAARKTAADVGDGTTTSTILAQTMISELYKIPLFKRVKVIDSLEESLNIVTDILDDIKESVDKSSDLLENIVNISCNGDSEVVQLIMKALKAAGPEGVLSVEMVEDSTSSITCSGGASITSMTDAQKPVTLTNASLVLTEGPITRPIELKPILKFANRSKKPFVIIAKEFSQEVRAAILKNRLLGSATVYLVESEGFGENRRDILNDLATIFDTIVYSTDDSTAHKFRTMTPELEVVVPQVVLTKGETILIPDYDHKVAFADVVESLQAELKTATTPGETANIKRRLAKYTTAATINVGGITAAEARERKDRVDDAVKAASAAVNGGIIPGGGAALYHIKREFSSKLSPCEDTRTVLDQVLEAPINVLCKNLGIPSYADKLKEPNQTVDLTNLNVVDAYKNGIMDPALVTITAIQNAFAVAKTIVNSNFYVLPYGLQS